ncbi:MAG: hypothetical protein GF417_08075 [Candidatus Latescibacteria bacterium]|nr:hypothetical protein [bacterium]MBD3424378.1 hypothetical protein [Candidatus Latescibacterota bacterium]
MILRRAALFITALYFLAAGCSTDTPGTDIYVMEELEAASSIADPERRVEHLRMFLGSYPDRYCRRFACVIIFKTLAAELGREEEAFRFVSTVERNEDDPGITGSLYYAGFSYLMDIDTLRAARYARDILSEKEADFRIFLYMGFDLDGGGSPQLAVSMFRKGLEEADNALEKSFAGMVLGEALLRRGDENGALDILNDSRENPFSGKYIGDIMWERQLRGKALDAYIDLAAGVPRMRDEIGLDSLYNLVHPGRGNILGDEILRRRTGKRKLLHDEAFTDTRGKLHQLSEYRGRKLVLGAWSPD